MKTLTVKKFTANCSKILEEIRETREPILICEGKQFLLIGDIELSPWPNGE